MNFGSKIKTLVKEAELYRSQGLLSEALTQFQVVEAMIRDNAQVKNRDAILSKISDKIKLLSVEIDKFNKPQQAPEVSEQAQKLMREMFSFDDPRVKGSAALGGAISLAEFGLYEKALEDFSLLFDYDRLRVDAAENFLKYGLEYKGASIGIHLDEWADDERFSSDEIEAVRQSFQSMLNEAGLEINSPPPGPIEQVEPDSEIDDEDILDISAIRLELPKGPQKDDQIEFDVNFQHGGQINLIVSQKEKGIIDSLDAGDLIHGVMFYSPVAIFSGTVYVLTKKPIGAGPKRGDFSVNLKIIRIEAG